MNINRKMIIPAISFILLIILLAPVSAKTVVTHQTLKGAWGYWMIEIPEDSEIWYSISVGVLESEESITLSIDIFVEGALEEEYDKELDPSEFEWNTFYCMVSTEIYGYTFTVEWDLSSLRPPMLISHSNELGNDGIRRIRNDVWREIPGMGPPYYSTITTNLPPFPYEVTILGQGEIGKATLITIEK